MKHWQIFTLQAAAYVVCASIYFALHELLGSEKFTLACVFFTGGVGMSLLIQYLSRERSKRLFEAELDEILKKREERWTNLTLSHKPEQSQMN